MIGENPRQIIIDALEKSEELYFKLQKVITANPNISTDVNDKVNDLKKLKKDIETMPLHELEEILKKSL